MINTTIYKQKCTLRHPNCPGQKINVFQHKKNIYSKVGYNEGKLTSNIAHRKINLLMWHVVNKKWPVYGKIGSYHNITHFKTK